jgi:hypothetical protein
VGGISADCRRQQNSSVNFQFLSSLRGEGDGSHRYDCGWRMADGGPSDCGWRIAGGELNAVKRGKRGSHLVLGFQLNILVILHRDKFILMPNAGVCATESLK